MSVTVDLSLNLLVNLIGAGLVAIFVWVLFTRREQKQSKDIITNLILPKIINLRRNMLVPIVNAAAQKDLSENFPRIAKIIDEKYVQIMEFGRDKLRKLISDPDLKNLIAKDARNLITPVHIQVLEMEIQDFRLAAGRYMDHLPPESMSALESFLGSVRHLLFIYHLVLNTPKMKPENISELVVEAWGRVITDSFYFQQVTRSE